MLLVVEKNKNVPLLAPFLFQFSVSLYCHTTMYICFVAEDKVAAFQSFTSRRHVFLHGLKVSECRFVKYDSLMNQHPIRGLIVSKQNWAMKQQREGVSVHNLRHEDPLCQPVYHIFCFHRNRIQATKETCLRNDSVRMCKSVQEKNVWKNTMQF
jgi:hypothetical protein